MNNVTLSRFNHHNINNRPNIKSVVRSSAFFINKLQKTTIKGEKTFLLCNLFIRGPSIVNYNLKRSHCVQRLNRLQNKYNNNNRPNNKNKHKLKENINTKQQNIN